MGRYVSASKDFHYDEGAINKVKRGQVFQLQGHPNDGGLLRHQLVQTCDITKEEFAKLPQCGECGRRFAEEWQRDRCGRSHEVPTDVLAQEARKMRQRRVLQMGV